MRYLVLELRRALRRPGTLLFVVGFPGAFYLLESVIFGNGIDILPAMAAWGVLLAGLLVAPPIVAERAAGWQRQLRLTPLSGAGYLRGKATVGLLVALPPPIVVALLAHFTQDVRLDASQWVALVGLTWLGALPFALLGILIGQLSTPESVQQVTIVGMLALAIFGGMFMPLDTLPNWFGQVGYAMPSYWLTELGRWVVLPDREIMLAGGILLGWALALGAAVTWRFRRDS
ncbi:ABC transporter permease [Herbidospora mongoliensis]|uniref:ABC transporter permease n=1 Tax=Herbidospora mongoliensis TaxID=688067 RepID=UPI0008362B2C|nr:ABC transporter permease [Herbidospora mongoliensis]